MTHTLDERLSAIEGRLDAVLYMQDATLEVLANQVKRTRKIMALLDEAIVEMEALNTVSAGVYKLLDEVVAKLNEAGLDPVKLTKLKADIIAQREAAAAAIVKNTPADPGGSMGGVPV